tara:strand:- start:1268 stop:1588 length:321 start_codon:yes stop_codon:yes gene_type:complete
MNLAIEILNKEIERREILLAVENNVLIQNDMSNEIGVLKDSVKNLSLSGVSQQRELLIMDKETVDFLDKKITDIRIQLAKQLDNNALAIVDKMMYDLQIEVFKCEN